MDHSCMKQLVNPYRECRKQAATYNRALSSMEKAAELLGVAVSTMSNYELGITVPPVDIIVKMADLYRAPQLRTMYCKKECLIGRHLSLATSAASIENITVRIIKQMDDGKLKSIKDRLINIAQDGKVSKQEAIQLRGICEELEEIVEAIGELNIIQERECSDGYCGKN